MILSLYKLPGVKGTNLGTKPPYIKMAANYANCYGEAPLYRCAANRRYTGMFGNTLGTQGLEVRDAGM